MMISCVPGDFIGAAGSDPEQNEAPSDDTEDTCDCAQVFKRCPLDEDEDACGDCISGYVLVGDTCMPDCSRLGCEGDTPMCEMSSTGPVCVADCPAPLFDDGNGHCVECADTSDCASGFHCDHSDANQPGLCMQECDPINPTTCVAPDICTANGRCLQANLDGNNCGVAYKEGDLVRPRIMVVLDQSGSMGSAIDPVVPSYSRWEAMNDALVDPSTGVISTNEDRIDFGLLSYQGGQCENGGTETFPKESPAPDNASTIATLLSGLNPSNRTPTGMAFQTAVDILQASSSTEPKFIILATDGQPNDCASTAAGYTPPSSPEDDVLQKVDDAYQLHDITTFAIGINLNTPHLDDVAYAGQGLDPSSGPSPLNVATDPVSLSQKLNDILGVTLSCDIRLDNFDPAAQTFTVLLNGDVLDESFWQFGSEPGVIELIGDACDQVINATGSMSLGVIAQDCLPPEL